MAASSTSTANSLSIALSSQRWEGGLGNATTSTAATNLSIGNNDENADRTSGSDAKSSSLSSSSALFWSQTPARGVGSKNDENMIMTNHKTMTTSKINSKMTTTTTRRAFGDISNRHHRGTTTVWGKEEQEGLVGEKFKGFAPTTATAVTKATTTATTPAAKSNKKKSLKASSVSQQVFREQTLESAHLLSTTTTAKPKVSKKRVEFALPLPTTVPTTNDSKNTKHQAPSAQAENLAFHKTIHASSLDDTEEIEKPAGRLWIEQQNHMDDSYDNSDDEDSLADHLLLPSTVQAILRERHQQRLQIFDDQRLESSQFLDEHVQTMLQADRDWFELEQQRERTTNDLLESFDLNIIHDDDDNDCVLNYLQTKLSL